MRDYSKVGPQFWTGDTGRKIRKLGSSDARVVAMYLITSPHANMLGLYHCPLAYIANDCGIPTEEASKALQRLSEVGFCGFDENSDCVWVFEMARFQIGEQLVAADLRCKGVQKEYAALPNNVFLKEFFDKYGGCFHMEAARTVKGPSNTPSEGPSKPRAGTGDRAGTGSGAGARAGSDSAAPAARSQSGRKTTKDEPAKTAEVWTAYSAAYRIRHGVDPIRNRKVNGMLSRFLERVPGEEAPEIAAFFVRSNRGLYVSAKHCVDLLLRDAEGLRTEWATGRSSTDTEARQADRTAATGNAFGPLIAEAEAREGATSGRK